MTTVVRVRRRPSEAFGPAPLGFPLQPQADLGAGLYVGALVTVSVGDARWVSGVVTELDAVWITVEVPE